MNGVLTPACSTKAPGAVAVVVPQLHLQDGHCQAERWIGRCGGAGGPAAAGGRRSKASRPNYATTSAGGHRRGLGLPYVRDYTAVLSQSWSYFPADTGFLYPGAQIFRMCGLVAITRCLVRCREGRDSEGRLFARSGRACSTSARIDGLRFTGVHRCR